MIHSNSAIEIALRIATKAHEGQIDRGGRPYIEHPKTVAAFCSSPLEKVVALLHDVIEDTGVSQQDLKDAGIPDEA
ncbi:MAG: hypothetical protein RR619_07485, partial [Raoultibacter sp.]